MLRWLLLLVILMPAVEIAVFIWIGGYIGPWWVGILIVLTGVIGLWLARKQGIETLRKTQVDMNRGYAPNAYVFDGLCILLGSVALLSPGFVTDLFGFCLLIPFTRVPFRNMFHNLAIKWSSKGNFKFYRW
ncbi:MULTISPECIES: FxsA family protein [Gracilibacillus]|uniref:FxsA family protein n=1 Tax=Gracilibacillus TaxID=74385 RepID=UPI000824B7E9|nr:MULTISPECIES: FxsA family protein [Gracilibacillus]